MPEVHRNINFFSEVVALSLKLFTQSRILAERTSQLSLRAASFGYIFGRNEHSIYVAVIVVVRDGRHDQVQYGAVFGQHLALQIIELTAFDQILQASVGVKLSVAYAEEIGNRSPDNFFSLIAQLLQPVIGDGNNQAITIDRVQHCWRRAVERSVFEVCARLIRNFRIHGDGAHELALVIILNDRVGQAVDDIARTGDETDRFVFQLPGAPQSGSQFIAHTRCAVRRRELFRAPADHLFAFVAQTLEHGVIHVEVDAVFGNRGRH